MKRTARRGTWQARMKDYVSSFYMTRWYWSVAGYW